MHPYPGLPKPPRVPIRHRVRRWISARVEAGWHFQPHDVALVVAQVAAIVGGLQFLAGNQWLGWLISAAFQVGWWTYIERKDRLAEARYLESFGRR